MKRFFFFVVALLVTSSAIAVPVRLDFTADGFQNGGAPTPGFDGPISGSITWNANDLDDPVQSLVGINFNLYGHAFTLADVGFLSFSTNTVFGGTARGVNAVVGDGAFTDFLLTFNHLTGQITSFAYSLQGKNNAIWWTPARIDSRVSIADVPEPASIALLAVAMAGLGVVARRR